MRVDAKERFLNRLRGVTDPEAKRRAIGEEFVRVFEAEARKLGGPEYLVQGTIYPDVVESGSGEAATIKSHHNVGGLPADMEFKGSSAAWGARATSSGARPTPRAESMKSAKIIIPTKR